MADVKAILAAVILGSACAQAQTPAADPALLEKARSAQDAPFSRGLQSFTCAVDFDWSQHLREAPRVGDEGTDEQIRTLIQPIKTRVTVSSRGAIPSSNLSEAEESQLPYNGMAEGLLKHAVQFSLNQWLMAANESLLPPPGAGSTVSTSGDGVRLDFSMQQVKVEALLSSDFRLQRFTPVGDEGSRVEAKSTSGPNGFDVTYLAVGEDGRFVPGNRIIATYTYQAVSGFQLPSQVVLNRESHHEVWHYKLTGCSVATSK